MMKDFYLQCSTAGKGRRSHAPNLESKKMYWLFSVDIFCAELAMKAFFVISKGQRVNGIAIVVFLLFTYFAKSVMVQANNFCLKNCCVSKNVYFKSTTISSNSFLPLAKHLTCLVLEQLTDLTVFAQKFPAF